MCVCVSGRWTPDLEENNFKAFRSRQKKDVEGNIPLKSMEYPDGRSGNNTKYVPTPKKSLLNPSYLSLFIFFIGQPR